ncbi:DUF3987 domain-containing protein, partial [Escherichia coli]|uniref:DUF3987 domain-containing protein n=1 Tax=Escherichia coli TaxID=562 RepID=UPI001057825B
MSFGQPCDEFPLSSLPPLIRDAVIEAQQITQAPLGLVAASALGAVSLVCQNLIDVCRLNTLRKGADESETLRQLEVLQKNSAEEPVRYKFIFNDATTAAIKNQLCGKWRSVGIMSDEAGIIFDGYTLSELPFINKMW